MNVMNKQIFNMYIMIKQQTQKKLETDSAQATCPTASGASVVNRVEVIGAESRHYNTSRNELLVNDVSNTIKVVYIKDACTDDLPGAWSPQRASPGLARG